MDDFYEIAPYRIESISTLDNNKVLFTIIDIDDSVKKIYNNRKGSIC